MSIHNGITRDRFIYVPGTGYEGKIGSLASHGCVRMRDADVVGRFELVDDGATIGRRVIPQHKYSEKRDKKSIASANSTA